MQCRNISSLYLSGVSPLFDDNFLQNLLMTPSSTLSQLQTIHIKQKAQLTRASLVNLMECCPRLKKIDLSAWNITNKDAVEIIQKNPDIFIIEPNT